jgi:putative tricarboxylic transport membrane protein
MSSNTPEDSAPESSAASTRTLEIATSLIILAIGSVVMWDSLRMGAGWGNDGPQSGYFPFYIGLLMNIASAVNLMLAFKSGKSESFVSKTQFKLVLAIFLPCLAYVAIMQWVGLYVASVVFIAMFMRLQGKFSVLKSAVTALTVVAVLFAMFEIWFKVPLIKGPLEAALGF